MRRSDDTDSPDSDDVDVRRSESGDIRLLSDDIEMRCCSENDWRRSEHVANSRCSDVSTEPKSGDIDARLGVTAINRFSDDIDELRDSDETLGVFSDDNDDSRRCSDDTPFCAGLRSCCVGIDCRRSVTTSGDSRRSCDSELRRADDVSRHFSTILHTNWLGLDERRSSFGR